MGGALGANVRYLFGLVLPVGNDTLLFVGTGARSITTVSSFSVGVVQLWENGRHALAAGYAALTLVGALVGVGAAAVVVGVR
jgi:fluoride ion exporter CrcB/FEX